MIKQIYRFLSERSYILVIGIALITLITLTLTLLPVDKVLTGKIWSYDKLGHLGMFGGWTFLVGYYRFIRKPGSLNLFVIFIVGVIFGAGVEILQYYMPFHRDADFFDIAFDALGCFIAVLALYKATDVELPPDARATA